MKYAVRLSTWHRRVPLARPFVTAVRRTDSASIVLVEAREANGRSGLGEAAISWRVTGASPAGVAAAVAGPLQDAVAAVDLDSPGSWWPQLRESLYGNDAALSAVDTALWNLAAQQAGVGLGQLVAAHVARRGAPLPPPVEPDAVATDITLSVAESVPALVAQVQTFAARGFHTVKLKVDASSTSAAAVPAVARALPHVRLRVDANQCWQPAQALATLGEWRAAGVELEFVEQPVAAGDLTGLTQVRAHGPYPVVADESVRTAADLARLSELGACDGVNVKLAKAGGLTPALELALAARERDLTVLVGCMLEAEVGVGAARALAAAVAPDRTHDLDGPLWLTELSLASGLLPVPDAWEAL